MEAIAYFRVSTQQQGQSGLGLAAQKEIVLRFLGNTPPLAEFVEVESGRHHKNRPELLAALEMCKKRKARLVIAKLDRLARNVAFISALMESGVEFVCCDNPHANRLMLHMLAAFAEHEREIISERIKAALGRVKADLAVNGHRVSRAGRVYTKLGGTNLEEARIRAAQARRGRIPSEHAIAFMKQLRSAGRSFRFIAAELNRWELKTGHGSRWYASTARSALARFTESANTPDDAIPQEPDDACVLSRNASSGLNGPRSRAIPSSVTPTAGRRATLDGERSMAELAEAYKMIDTFASVGAMHFDVTFLNIDKQKCGFRKEQTARQLRNSLPHLLPGLAERKQSLILRPYGVDIDFIQLDDLDEEQLKPLATVACLILQTSPGNHQAWVAVSDLDTSSAKDFARRLRKGTGADLSASGATRCAGTGNYKREYESDFPEVKILQAAPGRQTTKAQLQQLGLLAEPEAAKTLSVPSYRPPAPYGRIWPSYAKCLLGAPMRKDGKGPDRSLADYTWCKFAAQRGFSIDEIAAELPNVSERARERIQSRDPGYVTVTAKNGFEAAERGKQRNRA